MVVAEAAATAPSPPPIARKASASLSAMLIATAVSAATTVVAGVAESVRISPLFALMEYALSTVRPIARERAVAKTVVTAIAAIVRTTRTAWQETALRWGSYFGHAQRMMIAPRASVSITSMARFARSLAGTNVLPGGLAFSYRTKVRRR